MPPRGGGRWVEAAARIGADLPRDKPGRRVQIIERCRREGLNERLLSRMITAWQYGTKYVDERELRAAHRTIESLMTLENIDPVKAASMRVPTLQGKVSRAALDQVLRDATVSREALKGETASLPLSRIIDLCCTELGPRIAIDWTQVPNAGVGFLLGADAEFSHPEPEIGENEEILSVRYIYVWALTVSPHIRSSAICGAGEKEFLRSIGSLCWQYDCVSVFCSSEREVAEMKMRIRQCLTMLAHEMKPGGKIVFHTCTP